MSSPYCRAVTGRDLSLQIINVLLESWGGDESACLTISLLFFMSTDYILEQCNPFRPGVSTICAPDTSQATKGDKKCFPGERRRGGDRGQ